ncbi:MAG: hypothetical protein KKI08_14410, partial [Armatimonadetes bacterium]|nr:hypothetical protein [Armatimonadota bacterium]
EEEREAELVSSEELRLQLQRALEEGAQQVVEGLPDGIHSIRDVPKARGVFFCFECDREHAEERRAIWLYWDAQAQRFEDNVHRMVQLIACGPEEPRGHSTQGVYELLPKAITHIVQAAERTAAGERARPKLPPDQIAVTVALQQSALQGGVRRDLLLRLIRFLSNPMTRFAERRFHQFIARYQAQKDIKGLADAVDDLRVKFEGADAEREADAHPPIAAEDLRLVCFEYVS